MTDQGQLVIVLLASPPATNDLPRAAFLPGLRLEGTQGGGTWGCGEMGTQGGRRRRAHGFSPVSALHKLRSHSGKVSLTHPDPSTAMQLPITTISGNLLATHLRTGRSARPPGPRPQQAAC